MDYHFRRPPPPAVVIQVAHRVDLAPEEWYSQHTRTHKKKHAAADLEYAHAHKSQHQTGP